MALNYIWVGFFVVAFAVALVRLIFFGDTEVFQKVAGSTFDSAKTGFEISLGLTGVMTLWLGLMNVGEKAGAIGLLARLVSPFFHRLFPEIPKNHPAIGAILMNFSANMLGLDNAATPLGLKAMREMQELNPDKETASNAQIMFLVLNTAGLTIVPLSILAIRAAKGSANPADVFIPILLTTFIGFVASIIIVAIYQRINLFNFVILGTLGGITAAIGLLVWYFSTLPQEQVALISTVSSNIILLSIIVGFILLAVVRKINVYETFIEGAKEGFQVAVTIIPYLVAMLVAIGVFRASGAMDYLTDAVAYAIGAVGLNTEFVPALPVALMKPLSGSGARGLMVEVITNPAYGVDSFVGRVACVLQGSTETTFYVLAVYFGSVGIKKTRYSVTCGLLADVVGIVAAILLSYLFFH